MADYYPLIAKAVAGLDKSTGEARRALYERARTALVTQLRGVLPALSESDITRERLALEEAIRKVEAEAARKSRFDAPPERKRVDRGEIPDPFKPAAPPRPPAPPAPPGARRAGGSGRRHLSGTAADLRRPVRTPPPAPGPLSNDGLKGFRNVVADAENLGDATAQAGRTAREAYNAMPAPSPEFDRLEPRLEPEGLRARPSPGCARAGAAGAVGARAGAPGADQPATAAARARARADLARAPAARAAVAHSCGAARSRAAAARTAALARYRALARRDAGFRSPSRGDAGRLNEFSARDFAADPDHDATDARAPDFDLDPAPQRQRMRRRAETAAVPEPEERALPRSRTKLIVFLAIGAALLVVAGVVAWEWQPMVAALRTFASPFKVAAPAPQPPAAPSRQKINDRVGSNDSASPGPQSSAEVAQRVVLYEEDPEDPAGKRYVGSAVWRTESVARGAGQPPDILVRADIAIPERKMTMKWTLQRNADKTLPASHTVAVVFPPRWASSMAENPPDVLPGAVQGTAGRPRAVPPPPRPPPSTPRPLRPAPPRGARR